MEEYMHIRIPLVVLPIDGFSGKIIMRADFKIWINGAREPIRKADGFYIFTQLPKNKIDVHLKGPCYQKLCITLDISQLPPQGPILKVRVPPAADYPFPSNAVRLTGSLGQEALLTIFCPYNTIHKTLRADALKGMKQLTVNQTETEVLEGSFYYIADRKGTKGQIIQLLSPAAPEAAYNLNTPLLYDYPKTDTRLLPAVQTYSNTAIASAPYFLALPVCLPQAPGSLRFTASTSVAIVIYLETPAGLCEQQYTLTMNGINNLDF